MSRINYDLSQIRGFVFDVDGVLSPSVIPMSSEGEPMRMANIKDGYVIQLAAKLGYHMAIITGGRSAAIEHRFSALGVNDIYQGAGVKIDILKQWTADKDLRPDEIIYIGDDIPDIQCLEFAGLSCCPHDAAYDVKAIAQYISPHDGGYGCVRDILEQVLRAQKKWMHEAKAFGW